MNTLLKYEKVQLYICPIIFHTMLKYVIHTNCGVLAWHTIGMIHQKYAIHTFARVMHTSFLTVWKLPWWATFLLVLNNQTTSLQLLPSLQHACQHFQKENCWYTGPSWAVYHPLGLHSSSTANMLTFRQHCGRLQIYLHPPD